MRAIGHYLWRIGPGNPMVVRIVHTGSRRQRHLWARLGYLGAMVILVLIGLLAHQGLGGEVSLVELAKSGSGLFKLISYAQVILVCLLAPLFLATAIAQEQQGQTLSILLTTPLSNLQIVLGSYFGRLFFVLALLLSGLPLFAVLLIFGGVPMQSVFISFAVAALTAMTVGAAAVTLSVFRAGGRKAVFAFVIAIAAWLVGAYVFDATFLRAYFPGQTTWLTPIHPLLVLESTLDTANYKAPQPETLAHLPGVAAFYMARPFATFAILSLGSTIAMMVASALVLRHLGTGGELLLAWMRQKLRVGAAAGSGWTARSVWTNPIAWREAKTRGGGVMGFLGRWAFTGLGLVAAVVLLVLHHFGKLNLAPSGGNPTEAFRAVLTILLMIEITVIALVAIYMSAGSVSKEREDGTLDLMLTTPVTPKYYIWGKLRGLVSFLSLMIATPVLTLALVSVYVMVAQLAGWPQAGSVVGMHIGNSWQSAWTPLLIYEAPLLLLLLLVPFVAVCVMVGMNWSLKARGVLGAVVPTVAIVGVMTLVLGVCGLGASRNITVIGPILNAFSPATGVLMVIDPWNNVDNFGGAEAESRVLLLVAAALAAGGYCLVVWGMLQHMVSGFDHTVRRLSGTG